MGGRNIEEILQRIRGLKQGPADPGVAAVLAPLLKDRSNLVVAEAAKTAGALNLRSLSDDLSAAFERQFDNAAKKDPMCWAKTAIASALAAMGYARSALFLRGLAHTQMEPVYGGFQDTASPLRAACLLALVQCEDLIRIEVLRHAVDALDDPGDAVRLEAVRLICQMGGDEAELLLRLKARVGDARTVINGYVFDALLTLRREHAIPFIREFLANKPATRDEAALSLGASRLEQALAVLIETWNEQPDPEFRPVLLRAISATRQPDAFRFLMKVVQGDERRDALSAVEALKIHQDSADMKPMIAEAERIVAARPR